MTIQYSQVKQISGSVNNANHSTTISSNLVFEKLKYCAVFYSVSYIVV